MTGLLCAILIVLPQDPPVDEIAKKFPDPVPADRAWEMAAAYYEKICGFLRAKEFDQAREWDRMARGRLPVPYSKRLADKGREFWPKLRGYPGNRADVEDAAAVYIIALTGGDERELAVLKKRADKNPESNRGLYTFDRALAQIWLAEGEFPKVLRLLAAMEKDYPEEGFQKSVQELRATVEDIKGSGAETIVKCASAAVWAQETSWGGAFAILNTVRKSMTFGPKGATRAPLFQAVIHVLKSIQDTEGAKAFEDRLVHDPVSTPEEAINLLARRAASAMQKGDFKQAESIYREILSRWPDRPALSTSFDLARSLQMQGKYGEAIAIYDKIVAAKEPDEGKAEGRSFRGGSYGERAQFEIGACREGEGKWAEALKAYLACPDVPRDDGHGRPYRDLKIPEAVFRCRVKLKQVDEALKQGRDHVLESGRRSQLIVVGFVDLVVASGTFDAEEKRLTAAAPAKDQFGIGMALDYMRILKLRRDLDIPGLFAAIKDETFGQDLYQARWETFRDSRSWLAAETIECLAELGDAAVDFLEPIARLGVGRAYVALLALCRIRTERAQKLMANLEWVQSHLVQEAGRFKTLAKGERIVRSRLPEKPAAAPDPREAAKRKEAAGKIRERLPELTSKVKGVAEMLALDTDAGRFQALGETIFAWKKGVIVDEDLEDLVTFALDSKWALEPKPLHDLIRNNRVALAAPLVEPGLSSKDPKIRAEAIEILGGYRYAKAIPAFAQLLSDSDAEVVSRAIEALTRLEAKQHVPAIAEFLKKGQPEWRTRKAIFALGQLGAVEHADAIAGFLDSEDVNHRAAAAQALGKLGAKKYADKIRPLLKDKNEWVRKAAEEALKILEK